MTYDELNMMSAGWEFSRGSLAGDIVNNAKWGYTKKAYKTAQVTEHEISQILSWAAKEGIEVRVKADLTLQGRVEFNPKGICSMCRQDQPMGYHVHGGE